MKQAREKYLLLMTGIIVGIVYGGSARLLLGKFDTLDSITFLFVVPSVLGVLPLLFSKENALKSYRDWIFVPLLSIIAFFLVLVAVRLESLLCLLILAAPFILMALIAAFLYKVFKEPVDKEKNKVLVCLAVLPFVLAPLEESIESPSVMYEVKSETIIRATPKEVWENIIRVKKIEDYEIKEGFFNYLDVPRPVEATLDGERVGGTRIGTFEGGLKFVEQVAVWEPEKKLVLDIEVDQATIRDEIFDQHVLRGNYFKFVNATYQIEPLADGQLKLKLSSSYHLVSKVNFYANWWGERLLGDFQDRLLFVIKNRCEKN